MLSRSFYKVLEELGHNVSPPLPSLFSFKIKVKSTLRGVIDAAYSDIILG